MCAASGKRPERWPTKESPIWIPLWAWRTLGISTGCAPRRCGSVRKETGWTTQWEKDGNIWRRRLSATWPKRPYAATSQLPMGYWGNGESAWDMREPICSGESISQGIRRSASGRRRCCWTTASAMPEPEGRRDGDLPHPYSLGKPGRERRCWKRNLWTGGWRRCRTGISWHPGRWGRNGREISDVLCLL